MYLQGAIAAQVHMSVNEMYLTMESFEYEAWTTRFET
jgi:hypothetical protein